MCTREPGSLFKSISSREGLYLQEGRTGGLQPCFYSLPLLV